MVSAERSRRELANFEVQEKTRKRSGSTASKKNSKKASAASRTAAGGNSRKNGSSGTQRRNSASNQYMKSQTNTKKRKTAANRGGIEENPIARRNSRVAYMQEAPRRARRDGYYAYEGRDAYDEYDRYDRPPRRGGNGGEKRRRRRKKSSFNGMTALLLVLILLLCGFGYWRSQVYEDIRYMKQAVSRQTFYEGTTVDGVDVSRMTLQEALDYFDTQVEPAHREAAVTLNDGTQITAAQLGYSSDYAQVLADAWSAGRSGSLVERYKNIEHYAQEPRALQVNRTPYDDTLVRAFVAQAAQQVDTPARDASLKDFNVETYAFEFESEQVGRSLDQEALAGSIERVLLAGGGSVEMPIKTIAPAVTLENVSSQYGMISQAVTNASSSSSNRLSNIKLALQAINGFWLDPGESFSFNEVVGQRTSARGYKSATAYSGGKVTEEVGGGICQVSTTLFNAAVKADLQIDERHPHSLTVSYVDLGKDAAVDWGNKDLRFTNVSDDRIYICCQLTDDKRIRFGVFGKLLENGMSITLEGVKTGTVDYKTEYQMSFELFSGQTRVLQQGKKGYKATAYKVWWDAEGNEIKREELCKSNYQSTPEIIEYGP